MNKGDRPCKKGGTLYRREEFRGESSLEKSLVGSDGIGSVVVGMEFWFDS